MPTFGRRKDGRFYVKDKRIRQIKFAASMKAFHGETKKHLLRTIYADKARYERDGNLVVYHGTDKQTAESISDSELRPSANKATLSSNAELSATYARQRGFERKQGFEGTVIEFVIPKDVANDYVEYESKGVFSLKQPLPAKYIRRQYSAGTIAGSSRY